MSKKIAVYAGTFDPVTNGHWHIIEKAAVLFDKVIIVIADNPQKKCMFDLSQRYTFVLARISDFNKSRPYDFRGEISVEVLPDYAFLVNFARHKLNADCLVRSIRDNIDYAYEQKLYRTNRGICSEIETIYFMPDDSHSLISSSWVKELMGRNSWRDIVADAVPSSVLQALKVKQFDKELDFVNALSRKFYLDKPVFSETWKRVIESQYQSRCYHNIDHLLDGFEGLRAWWPAATTTTYFAWVMHDYVMDEEKSVEISFKLIEEAFPSAFGAFKTYVAKLIRATKHKDDIKFAANSEEAAFAGIDLMVLGRPYNKYLRYVTSVYDEYNDGSKDFYDKWKKGRRTFLEKMLAKDRIFQFEPLWERYEAAAISNMTQELKTL